MYERLLLAVRLDMCLLRRRRAVTTAGDRRTARMGRKTGEMGGRKKGRGGQIARGRRRGGQKIRQCISSVLLPVRSYTFSPSPFPPFSNFLFFLPPLLLPVGSPGRPSPLPSPPIVAHAPSLSSCTFCCCCFRVIDSPHPIPLPPSLRPPVSFPLTFFPNFLVVPLSIVRKTHLAAENSVGPKNWTETLGREKSFKEKKFLRPGKGVDLIPVAPPLAAFTCTKKFPPSTSGYLTFPTNCAL